MTNIFSAREVNKKYLSWTAWGIILLGLLLSYHKFPLGAHIFGDEDSYYAEVSYFAKYGMYKALSQGTSFLYSLLVFIVSKILFTDFLVAARVLSVAAFLVCCVLLLKCLLRFGIVSNEVRNFSLVYFGTISFMWLWKGLPDLVSISFLLGGFYLLMGARRSAGYMLAGVIVFLGFAVKPVVVFAVPALALFILLRDLRSEGWERNIVRTLLFGLAFTVCFVVYHVPGCLTYHRLMLEDKNHSYSGDSRLENHITWNEKNNYFELYNPHHRENKWAVSFEEVDSFERLHPEINLKTGFADFVGHHFGAWMGKVGSKMFLELPMHIQHGFFFARWTAVNRWVKNVFIIKVLTLILIAGMALCERRFIKDTFVFLMVPFLFYFFLCLYTIPQLEDNWLLFCLPLLALPVTRFLTMRVNVYLLLALQVVYLVTLT